MIKTITINELTFVASGLMRVWNSHKASLQMKGKSLFNLVGLKKEFETHLSQSQETVAALAEQHGGIFKQEIGGYEIPLDHQEAANVAITEFSKTNIDINYNPIIIRDEDIVPAELLELIFEYVEFLDE